MKRSQLISLLILSLAAGSVALGADNKPWRKRATTTPRQVPANALTFAHTIHQDNTDACVNAVAQACEGSFATALAAKVLAPLQARNLDFRSFIKHCGHYESRSGIEAVELFQIPAKRSTPGAGDRLLAIRTINVTLSKNKKQDQPVCKASVINIPGGVKNFTVSKSRAWITDNKGSLYYMLANNAVFKMNKLSNVSGIVAADLAQMDNKTNRANADNVIVTPQQIRLVASDAAKDADSTPASQPIKISSFADAFLP